MHANRPQPAAEAKPLSVVDAGLAGGRPFWQWPMYLFRRFRHINLALFDQAVVSGTNFATGILLARFLGLEEFGRFTLVWMAVLLVNMIQQALIINPMMSLGAKQQDGTDGSIYFGAVLVQQGILCAMFAGLTLVAGILAPVFFSYANIASLALPLAAVMVCFQLQEYVRRYFFTRRHMGYALLNDIASYGGQLIVLLAGFMTVGLQTEGVLWVIAATSLLAAIIGFSQMDPVRFCKGTLYQTAHKHWHFSKWLAAGAGMQWIGGQFFVIVSAAYFSAAAAGAIAAARNILGFTLILFAATDNIVSVRASVAYHEHGWPALQTYLRKVCIVGGLANGAICIGAVLLAPMLMTTVFGAEYSQYAYLVYWFAITHFLMFFIRPLNAALRAVEVTRPIAASSILPMTFSLVASAPLIKMMGLTGAMVVMLGTQVLLLIYMLGAVAYCKKDKC